MVRRFACALSAYEGRRLTSVFGELGTGSTKKTQLDSNSRFIEGSEARRAVVSLPVVALVYELARRLLLAGWASLILVIGLVRNVPLRLRDSDH
jgi:hypothetical protein